MANAPPCESTARRRWFQLTPDRVVALLLALEVFLFLSERFEWFTMSQHKGYAVVVASATICLVALLVFLWFLAALVFRWWFQFSIRSLLLLPVVVAIVCSWLAVERRRAEEQREAVAAIRALHAEVTYDYVARASPTANMPPVPPGPAWARRLLGEDFFADVVGIDDSLWEMSQVRLLIGRGWSRITDEWLEPIGRLAGIEVLDLRGSRVTDAGLKKLEGLTRLRELNLGQTGISDAGLGAIGKLGRLEVLNFGFTQVTDDGLGGLAGLARLRELRLDGNLVTDVGLKHIRKLGRLGALGLTCAPGLRTGA